MDSKSTQAIVPIEDVRDGVIILKDGSVAMIIQTSAVNFDLLSQNEQLAIIGSFAGLLNSLSFSIQIVIRSKRLDITNYLQSLVKAEQAQQNPLLKQMMQYYRSFVSTVIRENEVLDKQFFVIISVSALELGLGKSGKKDLSKAITVLMPRRDHVIRQLGRIGLKATQLDDERLVRLFYDIYNEPDAPLLAGQGIDEEIKNQAPTQQLQQDLQFKIGPNQPQPALTQQAIQSSLPPQQPLPTQNLQQPQPSSQQPLTQSRQTPFVVEELPEEYASV